MPRSVSLNAPSCDVEFLGEIHYLLISMSKEANELRILGNQIVINFRDDS